MRIRKISSGTVVRNHFPANLICYSLLRILYTRIHGRFIVLQKQDSSSHRYHICLDMLTQEKRQKRIPEQQLLWARLVQSHVEPPEEMRIRQSKFHPC